MGFREPRMRWVVRLILVTCIVLEVSGGGNEELALEQEKPQNVLGDGFVVPIEETRGLELELPREQKHRFQFDPLNPKNFVLVAWTSSTKEPQTIDNYPMDLQTVGTFIATNAIVCVPSIKIPINVKNVSNWYVHHVTIGSPHKTIERNELVVLFHPKFVVSRHSPHRLAMIILNESGEKKAKGMIPLFLTAFPFLPSVKQYREDDYALANCKMVVYTLDDSAQGEFAEVPFVTKPCKYRKKASKFYQEKVCGEMKMMKKGRNSISDGAMYPNDMSAPLVCGNVLVGLYTGIQNLQGNRYLKKGIDIIDRDLKLYRGHIGNDEQYTFTIPGGKNNFLFLGMFVNKKEKKMEWSMKIDMSQTEECIMLNEDVLYVPSDSMEGGGEKGGD